MEGHQRWFVFRDGDGDDDCDALMDSGSHS